MLRSTQDDMVDEEQKQQLHLLDVLRACDVGRSLSLYRSSLESSGFEVRRNTTCSQCINLCRVAGHVSLS